MFTGTTFSQFVNNGYGAKCMNGESRDGINLRMATCNYIIYQT